MAPTARQDVSARTDRSPGLSRFSKRPVDEVRDTADRPPRTLTSYVTAPNRDHGRHVRPGPPRPPRGRQRGPVPVRARRGDLRADRARPGRRRDRVGQPVRAPLPDDGDRDGVQPAVLGQPRRHRPRRPDLHRRHPARPARRPTRTPSCSSSPAPTRSSRSCPGTRPTSCSTLAHFIGVNRPGYHLDDDHLPARLGQPDRGPRHGDLLHRLPRAGRRGRTGLVPRSRRRRAVHLQDRPVRGGRAADLVAAGYPRVARHPRTEE